MRTPPHQIEDRHGFLMCTCGYIPPTACHPRAYQPEIGWKMLDDHVREHEDGLCHEVRYGYRCLLPRGHDGIHREGK